MKLAGPVLAAIVATLALAAGLLVAPSVSAGKTSVRIGSFTAAVGAGNSVDLEARDLPPPGLSAWSIDITYDAAVVTVGDCDAQHGGLCNPNFAANKIRVTGVNVGGLEGDVVLATIAFECKAAGSSTLALELLTFADSTPGSPQPISADLVNGKVTCTGGGPGPTPTPIPTPGDEKLPGDANCDGVVGAIDAALILQLGAGLLTTVPCKNNADVNGDGTADAIDAALILQETAGLI